MGSYLVRESGKRHVPFRLQTMFENKMFSRLRQHCKDKHYTCGKKRKTRASNIKLQGARRRKHHATEVGIRVEDKTFLKHLKKYGSNPVGGRDLPHPSRSALGLTQDSYTMGTGAFPGIKWPWRGADHPPTSTPEVKEILQLYLYSLSGPLWPVLG